MAWLTDTGSRGPTAVSHKYLASAQTDHCRDHFWRSFQLFCTFTFLIHLDWQVQVGSAAGLAGCWCQRPRQITFIITLRQITFIITLRQITFINTSCHITFIHFAPDYFQPLCARLKSSSLCRRFVSSLICARLHSSTLCASSCMRSNTIIDSCAHHLPCNY